MRLDLSSSVKEITYNDEMDFNSDSLFLARIISVAFSKYSHANLLSFLFFSNTNRAALLIASHSYCSQALNFNELYSMR